eukprot:3242843-Pyramimonas_sp.AAC.1
MAVTRGGPGCAALALLYVNPSDVESSVAGAAGERLLVAGRMVDMRRFLLWRTGCAARVCSREPGRATRYLSNIRCNCFSGWPAHSATAVSVA